MHIIILLYKTVGRNLVGNVLRALFGSISAAHNTYSSRCDDDDDECVRESTKSVVDDIIVMINRTSGVCTGL